VCAAAAAAGGFENDGTTEISPLQASTDAAQAADTMLAAGAAAAAVCGVHSPLNPSQEIAFAAELEAALQQRAPGKAQLLRRLAHLLLHVLLRSRSLMNPEELHPASLPLQPAVDCVMPNSCGMLHVKQQINPASALPHSFGTATCCGM
jgi:hypothetical protein